MSRDGHSPTGVAFPVAPVARRDGADDATGPTNSKVRLTIADIHVLCREGVKSVLGGFDWVKIVGEAADEAGLFALLDRTPTDAVLLDPGVSRGSHLDTVERIRELAPEVRVIVMATLAEHEQIRGAIELGAHAYVLKTATPDELATALRMVAEGRNYIQGDLVTTLTHPPSGSSNRPRLSRRHVRILQLVSDGLNNRQLATELDTSETSIKSQLRVIYSQLDASTRVEAVAAAFRLGIIA